MTDRIEVPSDRSDLTVQLLVRSYPRMGGLARYALMLQKGLKSIGITFATVEPAYPPVIQAAHTLFHPFGYDLKTFCANYPVAAQLKNNAITHLTTQSMASLFSFRPALHPSVITVHDIASYLMRGSPEQIPYRHVAHRYVDHLAMQNLHRADRIIAISTCTKEALVTQLGCAPEKIRVVLYGLDHETFKPAPVSPEFRACHNLDTAHRHILYVGSEDPRKNLPRLIRALAQVKAKLPEVRLHKVGTAEYIPQYEQLVQQVRKAGLEEQVVFHHHPTQDDLVGFYNAADVFVFPSLYEGFGMPPLEAMACGLPVVSSNASSLPEVVGAAAVTFDPNNVDAIVQALLSVLGDADLRRELRAKGIARAGQFTWERTARETAAVYRELGAAC